MTYAISVPTPFQDLTELAESFASRVDEERVMLPTADGVPEGEWVEFSVSLLDGSPVLAGVGRCTGSYDNGEERSPEHRFDVVLDSLQLDEVGQASFVAILTARAGQAEYEAQAQPEAVHEAAGAGSHASADESYAPGGHASEDDAYFDQGQPTVAGAASADVMERLATPDPAGDEAREPPSSSSEATGAVAADEQAGELGGGAARAADYDDVGGSDDTAIVSFASSDEMDASDEMDDWGGDPDEVEAPAPDAVPDAAADAVQDAVHAPVEAAEPVPDALPVAEHGAAGVDAEASEPDQPAAFAADVASVARLSMLPKTPEGNHDLEAAIYASAERVEPAPLPSPLADPRLLTRPIVPPGWLPEPRVRPEARPSTGYFDYAPGALPVLEKPPRPDLADPGLRVDPAPKPGDEFVVYGFGAEEGSGPNGYGDDTMAYDIEQPAFGDHSNTDDASPMSASWPDSTGAHPHDSTGAHPHESAGVHPHDSAGEVPPDPSGALPHDSSGTLVQPAPYRADGSAAQPDYGDDYDDVYEVSSELPEEEPSRREYEPG